jgi:hypothetical protein
MKFLNSLRSRFSPHRQKSKVARQLWSHVQPGVEPLEDRQLMSVRSRRVNRAQQPYESWQRRRSRQISQAASAPGLPRFFKRVSGRSSAAPSAPADAPSQREPLANCRWPP